MLLMVAVHGSHQKSYSIVASSAVEANYNSKWITSKFTFYEHTLTPSPWPNFSVKKLVVVTLASYYVSIHDIRQVPKPGLLNMVTGAIWGI